MNAELTYVSRMITWLNNVSNLVPLTTDNKLLEPSIQRMCSEFAVTRLNNDIVLALNLFREGIESKVPSVIKADNSPHSDWYIDSTKKGIERPIWNRLRTYLIEKRNRSVSEVAHINTESDTVTNALRNPNDEDAFQHRGMVVGYVQSGKTTNMSALIAKSSDAGYRCIVVLAGVLDTLRQQTQFRFQQELFGHRQSVFSDHNANASYVPDDDSCRIKAVTNCAPNDPALGEITQERLDALFHDFNDIDCWKTTRVFVIKKTTRRIDLLTNFFKTLNRMHVDKKFNVQTLIIDDECDQATINTKSSKGEVTAINKSIRTLLSNIRRNSYVGYTATPFANLFIDPNADDTILGKDLYPKDFIATLAPPPHYMGTKELFGIASVDNPELDRRPLNIIISIPENEHKNLTDKDAKSAVSISSSKNESLYNSILDFVVSCALQQNRGRTNEDMTMLIHPSAIRNIQNRIYEPLVKFVENLQKNRNDESVHEDLRRRLEEEFNPRSNSMRDLPYAEIPKNPIKYAEIIESIKSIIGTLDVKLLHGNSAHVLKYGDKENPKRYIVIGGNKLSRGLTLEGLSVSYFLRKSTTYDTLLQMGRWFGYRAKYADLTRLYMSDQMSDHFSKLAYVELNMRSKFAKNYLDARTPAEVATHIVKISGLNIVPKNKLGGASLIIENYAGRQLEQKRLDILDPSKIILRNNKILSWLSSLPAPEKLTTNRKKSEFRNGSYFWTRPFTGLELADALENIDLGDLKKELILKALRNTSENTDINNLKWYLAVSGKESGTSVGHFTSNQENFPVVAVNRRLKNTVSSDQLMRLISGGEISDFIRPKILELGDDPNKVGIICIYFVNSSSEVLAGDKELSLFKSKLGESLVLPFIASFSLIVPDAAVGTMYVGLNIPMDQSEEETEVESDK